jgi:hypothetical protein
MELDEKFVDVIVKRYIKHKNSNEDCYLIRDGKRTPVSDFEYFENKSL